MRLLRNTFIAILLLAPSTLFAQIASEEPLRYIVSPENPGPNQQVIIQAEGVGSFLGDAQITWRQDGTIMRQGVGERNYTFRTGGLGTRTTVAVTIASAAHGTFSKSFVFSPSVVTLVWEADTTTPHLHRGKALYSPGSTLKVLALPTIFNGTTQIAASALSYQWQRDDEPVASASGLGRYSYTFTGDQLKAAESISVDVYYGGAKVGRGELTIAAQEPRLLFYQFDALRGPLYDGVLPGGISLISREITVKAEPYYFSGEGVRNKALTYSWELNGEGVTGPDSARGILTLRQNGEGTGEAQIGVSLQNFDSSKFVQAADSAIRIIFGASGESSLTNFFGL